VAKAYATVIKEDSISPLKPYGTSKAPPAATKKGFTQRFIINISTYIRIVAGAEVKASL